MAVSDEKCPIVCKRDTTFGTDDLNREEDSLPRFPEEVDTGVGDSPIRHSLHNSFQTNGRAACACGHRT